MEQCKLHFTQTLLVMIVGETFYPYKLFPDSKIRIANITLLSKSPPAKGERLSTDFTAVFKLSTSRTNHQHSKTSTL